MYSHFKVSPSARYVYKFNYTVTSRSVLRLGMSINSMYTVTSRSVLRLGMFLLLMYYTNSCISLVGIVHCFNLLIISYITVLLSKLFRSSSKYYTTVIAVFFLPCLLFSASVYAMKHLRSYMPIIIIKPKNKKCVEIKCSEILGNGGC